MTIETDRYIRKPLFVNAVRVTEGNFDAAVMWCDGVVETESAGPREGKPFIKVSVHGIPKSQRQTKAFVGDWLLHTERGFKVYTDNAFRSSFNPVDGEPGVVEVAVPNGISAELVREPVVPQVQASEVALAAEREELDVIAHTPEGEAIVRVGDEAEVAAPIYTDSNIAVSDSDSAPPPQAEDGRRILTQREQVEMDAEEVTELLRSGEAILEQDLV